MELKPYKIVTSRSNSKEDLTKKILKKYPEYEVKDSSGISDIGSVNHKYYQHFKLVLKKN